jgi:hypothetical protein
MEQISRHISHIKIEPRGYRQCKQTSNVQWYGSSYKKFPWNSQEQIDSMLNSKRPLREANTNAPQSSVKY